MENRIKPKDEGNSEIRNFRNPDPLNCGLEGHLALITTLNGRTDQGIITVMGQYSLILEVNPDRRLIINKSAIVTVTVLDRGMRRK
jgi:sRNA-binding regulator protein Hfq